MICRILTTLDIAVFFRTFLFLKAVSDVVAQSGLQSDFKTSKADIGGLRQCREFCVRKFRCAEHRTHKSLLGLSISITKAWGVMGDFDA